MSPVEYKRLRKKAGTQREVAHVLGISRETVARRESGAYPIDPEAALAIRALAEKGAVRTEAEAKSE